MQQLIAIGQTGEVAKDIINDNFSELYASIPTPIKLPGEAATFQTVFAANTKLVLISMIAIVGTPTLRVGITPNGDELVQDSVINDDTDFKIAYYCKDATTIYFTFALGPGRVNVRVNAIPNYY